MCGLVAIIPKNKQTGFHSLHTDIFTEALITDSLRGVDGTGVVMVDRWGGVKWVKVGDHPFKLVQSHAYVDLMKKAVNTGALLFGHNRKATVGNITNENAHPHMKDHIIMVHNGMVSNHAEIGTFDVDSMAVAEVLAKHEDPLEALSKIRGAFALMWYDLKTRTFYVVRNQERPLFHVDAPAFSMLVSEPWIGTGIVRRNLSTMNAPIKAALVEENELWRLTDDWKFEKVGKVTWKPFTTGGSTTYFDSAFAENDDGNPEDNIILPQDCATTNPTSEEMNELAKYFATGTVHKLIPNGTRQVWVGGSPIEYCIGNLVTPKQTKVTITSRFPIKAGDKEYWLRQDAITVRAENLVIYPSGNGSIEVSVIPITRETLTMSKERAAEGKEEEGKLVSLVWRTYNDVPLSGVVWKHITDTCECEKCKGKIDWTDSRMTIVRHHHKKNQRVTCKTCVMKQFKLLSPVGQKAVIKRLGFDPLTGEVDEQQVGVAPV